MNILVLGSRGFLGKNLVMELMHHQYYTILEYDKDNTEDELNQNIVLADFIFHFAAVQRPADLDYSENYFLTKKLISILERNKLKTPIFFSSSIQAKLDNTYGECKRKEEELILKHAREHNSRVIIYRFSNIYGPYSRPNYTSVVATFMYNASHGLPVTINNVDTKLNLIYVKDVVNMMIDCIEDSHVIYEIREYSKYNMLSLAELIFIISMLKNNETTRAIDYFGAELIVKMEQTFSYFRTVECQ